MAPTLMSVRCKRLTQCGRRTKSSQGVCRLGKIPHRSRKTWPLAWRVRARLLLVACLPLRLAFFRVHLKRPCLVSPCLARAFCLALARASLVKLRRKLAKKVVAVWHRTSPCVRLTLSRSSWRASAHRLVSLPFLVVCLVLVLLRHLVEELSLRRRFRQRRRLRPLYS